MSKQKVPQDRKVIKRPLINRILADEINPFCYGAVIFVLMFLIEVFLDLFIGVSMGRFYLGDSNLGDKLKISEIPGRLPGYFYLSSVTAIMCFIFINESQKSKKKEN